MIRAHVEVVKNTKNAVDSNINKELLSKELERSSLFQFTYEIFYNI